MDDYKIDCPRCEGSALDCVEEPCGYCDGRGAELFSWFYERHPHLGTPKDRAAVLASTLRASKGPDDA